MTVKEAKEALKALQRKMTAYNHAQELIYYDGCTTAPKGTAENRSSEIVADAREKATALRRQAEADAVLEKKKAEDDMKREIADVSTQLTGKLLQREINEEDHRALIDSFLQEIGTDDDNK